MDANDLTNVWRAGSWATRERGATDPHMRTSFIVPAIVGMAIAVGVLSPGFAAAPNVAAGEHHVIAMYANGGNANSEEIQPSVDTVVDQATITCPKPTCTLALSAMQAIEDGDGTHEWAILAFVDGAEVGSPNYQGLLPINNYLTGNWQGSFAVSQGHHVVSFQIFGEANFILDSWSDSVTVTDP
jgi:hypothetical protein